MVLYWGRMMRGWFFMDVIFRSTDTPTQNAAIKSRGIVDELVLLNLKRHRIALSF